MALNHFPHVYQPIQVGGMTLKNRIQYSPMVSNHADFVTGAVTNDLIDFVRMQAQTGVGLVSIGSTPVDFDRGRDFCGCLSILSENDTPGLRLLTQAVHEEDCKISVELSHAGQWAYRRYLDDQGKKAFVPSLIPKFHNPDLYEEIGVSQIKEVVEHFRDAADRCVRTGFDMVMIHLAHGNLLSAFLSTAYNHRTDEYGGSPENRWRFPIEVIKAVHSVTKGKAQIEVRVAGDECIPNGTTLEERIAFLKEIEPYVDMVIVSGGTLKFNSIYMCHTMPAYYMPHGLNVECAAKIKEALHIPVSVVGGISSLQQAEEIIASGKADICAMCKALFADEHLVLKGQRGQEDDIRPCMRCMYCARNIFDETHLIGCAANPRLGWESRYPRLYPPIKKKKVMVVGGGPGGMEAAQILTERGHEVVLYEKSDTLGGRLPETGALPMKDGHRAYCDYMIHKTMKSGTRIELGKAATADTVLAESPDTLIVAIGAQPIVPPIPGIDGAHVHGVVEVDRGEVELGQKVVLCGGGMSGLECALNLALQGKDVTVIDMKSKDEMFGPILFFHRAPLMRMLEENHVTILERTGVKQFEDGRVVCAATDGSEIVVEADDFVLAFGLRINREEVDSLCELVPETYVIGDAKQVGVIGDATNAAYRICYDI